MTPRPPDQVRAAPLPPQLRGQRGEEAEAATKRIQKIHRGRQARRELNEQKAAAIRIQSIQRGKSARSQQQPPLHEPAPAPAPTPEVEVADEVIAAALEKGVVAAYDDMVEAAIAGVIDGSRKVLPLPPAPHGDLSPARASYQHTAHERFLVTQRRQKQHSQPEHRPELSEHSPVGGAHGSGRVHVPKL